MKKDCIRTIKQSVPILLELRASTLTNFVVQYSKTY